jgi:signal transduction histidine kinase
MDLKTPELDPVPASPYPGTGDNDGTPDGLLSRPIVQDALIASALTATSLVGVVNRLQVDIPEGGMEEAARLDEMGTALILLQTAPLVWRRRSPVAVMTVITAALFLFSILGYFRSFASFGFLIALYTVAAYRDRRTSIPIGVASGLIVFVILAIGPEPIEPDAVIAMCLTVGGAWFIGDGFRIRRGEFLQLEDRATRLEREREESARRAVAEERRAISRELHDVVAHNVSVIVAQAGAAQRLGEAHPHDAQAALEAIERAGREALVEMRRLMGLLRTGDDRGVTRSPQPGLDGIGLLVNQVRKAGLPVELRVEGARGSLPPGVDLSAYRIVQESLTNIVKHAGPVVHVEVITRYDPGRLVLTIQDDGVGWIGGSSKAVPPGYGHLGMRERVAVFGGTLTTGPRPEGGGFRVQAVLPLDGEPTV